MKIIEVTNSSNIGSYKNTPNCEPVHINHGKVKPGSRASWKEELLTENNQITLSDLGLSPSDMTDVIYTELRNSYEGINNLVDSDKLSAKELQHNEDMIKKRITSQIMPEVLSEMEFGGELSEVSKILNSKPFRFKINRLITNLSK